MRAGRGRASRRGRGSRQILIAIAPWLLWLGVAACERPAVAWEEPRQSTAPAGGDAVPFTAGVTVTAAGDVHPATAGDIAALPDSGGRLCSSSVRLAVRARAAAADGQPETYAAWWAVRPDSSALLLAARSGDGGRTWARTLAVDTLDRSGRGCARPAPAVAVDSANGFVHVAYFMEAPEGPGLFYAHLMDPRVRFEPAAVVVYGERPSAASVASHGDTVVVAYENPNGERPRVELAISYTAGHLFDRRGVLVSSPSIAAEAPSVALAGRRLAVAWLERPTPASPPVVVVRQGELR